MEHVLLLLLPPVVPPVFPYVPVLYLAIPVLGFPGDHSHTKLVGANIFPHTIFNIKVSNFSVQPIQLFFLVSIVGWLRPVVLEPGKLWGVQERSNGDCIFRVVVIWKLLDKLDKPSDDGQDKLPAIVLDQVIVPCDHVHVHGFGVLAII